MTVSDLPASPPAEWIEKAATALDEYVGADDELAVHYEPHARAVLAAVWPDVLARETALRAKIAAAIRTIEHHYSPGTDAASAFRTIANDIAWYLERGAQIVEAGS